MAWLQTNNICLRSFLSNNTKKNGQMKWRELFAISWVFSFSPGTRLENNKVEHHKWQKSACHCLIWCLLQRTCILRFSVIIFAWVMIHFVAKDLYWWQINMCGYIKHVFPWMCDCFTSPSSEYKQMLLCLTAVWISRIFQFCRHNQKTKNDTFFTQVKNISKQTSLSHRAAFWS